MVPSRVEATLCERLPVGRSVGRLVRPLVRRSVRKLKSLKFLYLLNQTAAGGPIKPRRLYRDEWQKLLGEKIRSMDKVEEVEIAF